MPSSESAILTQPKRLALLAYLLLARPYGPQRKDAVIGLLWPDAEQTKARRALSKAIYYLRQHLGDDAIVTRNGDVAVDERRLSCDAREFQRAIEEGRRKDALALYNGILLPGLYLNNAADFEQWLENERARMSRLAVDAAVEETAIAREANNNELAADWARRALDIAPYDERAALELVRAIDKTGGRAAALLAHKEFAERLQREFDLAPSEQFDALEIELRAQRNAWRIANGNVATHAEPISGSFAPSRRLMPWAAAASIAIALAIMAATRRNVLERLGFEHPQSRIPVVLLPFAGHSGDSILASAATVAARVDLAQSTHVRVVGAEQIEAALLRMKRPPNEALSLARARELAIREGIPAVVTGDVARAGLSYIVSGRIIAAKDGTDAFATRVTAIDSSGIISAIDEVTKRIREALGDSRRALRAEPPLARVTTSSLEALRLYTQAEGANSSDEALALLDQAVAMDSTFAMAHWRKAPIYRAWTPRTKYLEAVEKAWSLRDRLPEPERSYASAAYYGAVLKQPEKRRSIWESVLERDSTDHQALNSLTDYYMTRDIDRAWQYGRRAVDVTKSGVAYYNAFVLAVARADFRTAGKLLNDFERENPKEILIPRLRGELAAAQRNYAEAERYFRAYLATAAPGTFDHAGAIGMLAPTLEMQGRGEEAEELLRRDLKESAALGPEFVAQRATSLRNLMILHKKLPPNTQTADYAEEIQRFRAKVDKAPAECRSCGMYDLANAYDHAGQRDSAVAIYQRALNTVGTRTIAPDALWRSKAVQRVSELKRSTLR
ncbi:MAG TPA: BTAD domain-containing putative transcriptional regulator [Longimicrobiales bacterium]|nr:BTAD domain-containing putative transcriptional regulator [Longimicrobiales bacterium]